MSLCQPVIWSMAAILQLRDSTVVVVLVLVAAAVVRTRPRAIPLAMILTHSILGAPLGEHKAPTNFFHSDRSWASHRSSFHVFPAVFHLVLDGPPPSAEWSAPVPLPRGRPRERLERMPAFLHAKDMAKPRPPSSFLPPRTMLFIPVHLQISSSHIFPCHLTFQYSPSSRDKHEKINSWVSFCFPYLGCLWGSAMKQIRHIGHFWHKPSLS